MGGYMQEGMPAVTRILWKHGRELTPGLGVWKAAATHKRSSVFGKLWRAHRPNPREAPEKNRTTPQDLVEQGTAAGRRRYFLA